MKRTTGIRSATILAFALAFCIAAPARAEWKKAESPNFVVYSRGSESALRRYVRNLEIYDFVLRDRMGMPIGQPSPRKLPIYLVNGRAGLTQINPRTGPNVAGTYFPVGEDIFAAAIQDQDQDYLLHEYFHHFSMQIGSTATLPGWLTEGLAEYFMTAEIDADSVKIGGFNEDRVQTLFNTTWIPLEDLLSKRFSEVSGQQRYNYYPLSWLLTHWFMSDDERRLQLAAYIREVQKGTPSPEAMEGATGMTLTALRGELRRYRRINMTTYRADFPQPEIVVTSLPKSADDLLLIGQRLKVGVAADQRDETAALVRRLAARHPDDPLAMLHLGHAELHFGDADVGESVLIRLLESEPENVEALQLLATRFITLASEKPEDADSLMRRAKGYLARAYAVAPTEYYTLQLLSRTRDGAADYPTENDLVTLYNALTHAPQLPSIRIAYASALMRAEEFSEASILLEPLANAAHGGGSVQAARLLLERARAGQRPLTEAELESVADSAEDSSDDQPAEPGSGSGAAEPDRSASGTTPPE